MASVLKFFKRKIRPFKRCVTNPSQISFDRQDNNNNNNNINNRVKKQKSLDDNYYDFKYRCNNNDHDNACCELHQQERKRILSENNDGSETITSIGVSNMENMIATPLSCPTMYLAASNDDDDFTSDAMQVSNNTDLLSTCCTKASSYCMNANETTSNDADDGLKIETKSSQASVTVSNTATAVATSTKMQLTGSQHHMIHESTPFYTNYNQLINSEMNSDLKNTLQETIPYDDTSTAIGCGGGGSNSVARMSTLKRHNLKRCNQNSKINTNSNTNNTANGNTKAQSLMNGTYTIGNKMKLKSNSIKSSKKNYKFFSRNKIATPAAIVKTAAVEEASSTMNENEMIEEKQNKLRKQLSKHDDYETAINTNNNKKTEDNEANVSNCSAHSDSLCDPLFSSTLKSSLSALCDDSSVALNKKLKEMSQAELIYNNKRNSNVSAKNFENGTATVMASKTALKKCLIKNTDDLHNPMMIKEINMLNNLHENSMEKMRRSISLPGVNEQVKLFNNYTFLKHLIRFFYFILKDFITDNW